VAKGLPPTVANPEHDSPDAVAVTSAPVPGEHVVRSANTPPEQTEEGSLAAPGVIPDLGDRYRIVAELGRGGMGTVYVARDLKLERQVAIKVLHPGVHTAEQLRRFEQEARAVASLDHPNVLAIHDISSHADTCFIVSELLRGETLRQKLSKGPLATHAVLELGLQLAHGLAAAHDKGIVHRDLKPDNIFVSDEGGLKILDFGIAKLMSPTPDSATLLHTQSGAVIGTAEYMSPEQVRSGSVDQRADVFSFGAVLYEMLAGRRPFQRGSLVETGYAILTADPDRLPDKAPADLKRIVRRCLEKAPEKRFPSAREVARELESYAAALAKAEEAARSQDAWRRRLGIAILAVVAAALLVWKWPTPPPVVPTATAPHAPLTLLVADFQNATADPVFDGTFEPIITLALEGASFVNAYRRQDARKVAAKLRPDSTTLDEVTARLVAMREGIATVISGSIRTRGDGYTLIVVALEPRGGKVLVQRQADVPDKAQVLPGLGTLAANLRGALGDTTPQSERLASIETFTSGSIQAAHEYAVAQDLQHRGRAEEALVHYGNAIGLDPNLGRAYAGMAVVSHNLHRLEEAEKYFQKALALIDRMSERERYRTRGLYYVVERDYEKAVEEWTALVTRFPADTIGFVNLAVAQCMRRDMPKALEAGAKALKLAPTNQINRSNVAVYTMYSGDFEAALRLAREVVEASPTYLTPRVVMALSELGGGHPEGALAAYRDLVSLGKGGASIAAQGIADLALYQGRPSDAIAALEQQIPIDEADNRTAAATKLVMLASAQLAFGQPVLAVRSLDRAVALSKAESVLLAAARVYVDAGNEKKARALAADLGARRAPEPQAYAKLIEGNAALKRGEPAVAIRLLREAQHGFDTWIGRFDLGRAYLQARAFAEAHEELDACVKRRGEASALFIDEVPTYRYFPDALYWLAKSQEGLKSPAAADSYRAYLAIKEKADAPDPLIAAARASSGAAALR
jgi:tetratricopeptide (TPR) repeat protein/tRNA A-37 threonylcarbamoyl transferase component Bud32